MSQNKFETVVKKIPGNITGEPKTEKQGYIGDLSKKTKLELLDLLSRQNRLLNNKNFISKLPDKGERITTFRNKIEAEIQKRNESEKLADMLSTLNINGKEGLDNLEWSGKSVPSCETFDQKEVNNEEESDDETNPLKIFAGHSGAGFHKKKLKVIKPEEPLIKPSDFIDVESDTVKNDNSNIVTEDEYAKILRSKLDAKSSQDAKERFLPHRTINPSKNKEVKDKKQSKHWEVTAATPPLPVHGDTKLVSLEESFHLQFAQEQKLKELQMKHAAERLAGPRSFTIGGVPQNTTEYREHAESSSSDEESSDHEAEVIDEDDHGGGDVVIYNLVDP